MSEKSKRSKKRFFVLLKAEGSAELVPETNNIFKLKELVGGFVERGCDYKTGLCGLWDEEANLKAEKPPFNESASNFFDRTLLGDVVVCKEDGVKFVGWTEEEANDMIKKWFEKRLYGKKRKTVSEVCSAMKRGDWGCSKCGDNCDCPKTEEIVSSFADQVIAAYISEVSGLNKKIYEYEKILAESPIGLIYQMGICNQDGDVMNGIGLLFTNEAEKAKMPRVRHGDKFYVVPMELAHKVKGVVA